MHSLPVLKSTVGTSAADLVRLFHQSQLEWARHLGEETELDFGRWISNPALPDCDLANCLLDAYLVPGTTADDVVNLMDQTSAWRMCTLNPSIHSPGTESNSFEPVLQHALTSRGWIVRTRDILYRKRPMQPSTRGEHRLMIIPARASYANYQRLMQERNPATADEAMLHLDDSRFDVLLAMENGNPVASIGVLIGGEVGTIREWFVSPSLRGRGIGQLMLNRALEICDRSLLRHVMISLPSPSTGETPDAARSLCQPFGFESVGQIKSYHRFE